MDDDLERAIYGLWVIVYAVRNSSTLEPVDDLYPDAFRDLDAFARSKGLHRLRTWLASASDEDAFCDAYYDHFEEACSQLRTFSTFA
ncbi:hypothetical protein [Alloalcanivorax xenomutans]|uniref:hypothetical protein n=1 Tax=Alloalcanivorax xenomutans TaxID=1094342 RepID=UPI003BABB474